MFKDTRKSKGKTVIANALSIYETGNTHKLRRKFLSLKSIYHTIFCSILLIQIWNLESYVKNSSHPEKSKIREKIAKFSWGFFSKIFWLFSEYYFVFFCLKNLKPYVEKSSHPKRAIWTSLLPHCAISRFKFPFCKKKIKFDKSGLDFVILPVIIPVRKIIRKLFSRVYERSGTRGINRTASFRSAKTKTPTESTEQEPTQVCVNKSIQTKMFHYLPNYPARLHDFFTTEGDNWRGSKTKASVAVLSEARFC